VEILAVAIGVGHEVVKLAAEEEAKFQVNLFQVIIAAANFVVFLVLLSGLLYFTKKKVWNDVLHHPEELTKKA